MSTALWIAAAALLVALVWLQLSGVRALRDWGVEPSRAVLALRAVNTVAVVGLVAFAFYEWAR